MKYGVETGVAIKARSHPPTLSLSLSLSVYLILFLFHTELEHELFGIYVRANTRAEPVRMTGHGYLQSMQKGEKTREALKRIMLLSLISEWWREGERSCALHATDAFRFNRAHINELELNALQRTFRGTVLANNVGFSR